MRTYAFVNRVHGRCTREGNQYRSNIAWFDPGLMDRLKLVLVSFLKSNWTDITKITMTTFAIVKTFDVIKYISLRFVSR